MIATVLALSLALLLIVFPITLYAQATAQISGTVRDETKSVLAGVEVKATQTETGITRTAITNETGGYVIPNLPVGPYRLEASLPGFRTHLQTGITLQVGSNPTIDAVLRLGPVAEFVEIRADVPMSETRGTGVGQVMDNARLLELPVAARQVTELVTLSAPAVQGSQLFRGTNLNGSQRGYPAPGLSVGGGGDNALSWRLDGGAHNDSYAHLNAPLPFPDALQEFKVETSALSAQYGQLPAGAVNAVTKSGTNQFHGSLFEFVRNNDFNARNAFAVTDDGLKRNQFGGTLGGPVAGNRVFFFGGYQGTRQRSRPTNDQTRVPTTEMLAGDWRRFAAAGCSAQAVTLRAPFTNNQIDPGQYSRVALNILKQLPTTDDPCGVVRFGRLNNMDEDVFIGRMDFQWSDAHQVFVRYMMHEMIERTYDGASILSLNTDNDRRYQSAVVGSTFTVSPTLVNSFRATLLRGRNDYAIPGDFFTLSDMGARNVWYPEGWKKSMRLSITGGPTWAVPPGLNNPLHYEFSNDLSWQRGAHQLTLGSQWLHRMLNSMGGGNVPGTLSFTGNSTGLGLADFMLGNYARFQQSNVSSSYWRQNYTASFVQDTWRVSSRLTLNLGLRWEPYLPQYSDGTQIGRFKREWFDQGLRSTVFRNAPAGLLYSGGDPGMPGDNKVSENRWMQFAPRAGLAFDPGGDGRMVIRAGYGIFYSYPHMAFYGGLDSSPPYGNVISRANVRGGLDDPWAGYAGGNPFPTTISPDTQFLPATILSTVPEDSKAPYVNQWHLTVQRQIGTDWMVAANYLGNLNIHELDVRESNPGVYIPGSTASLANRRVLALANPAQGRFYDSMNYHDDGGTASYNALWLQLQRRRARGFTVQANYTWSHCIDDASFFNSGNAGKYSIERRGANRGNCRLDRRHSFSMSTVYETPRVQFSNPLARALASNWRLSLITRILSGPFTDVSCSCDNAGTGEIGRPSALIGGEGQRAQQILGDPYAPNKNAGQYLNPAAFTMPAVGAYGNSGRGSIQGPGSFRMDMGLSRLFRIRENQTIEMRAEAFNVLNRVNLFNPVVVLTDPNFGRILAADDPRIMQFALRYVF